MTLDQKQSDQLVITQTVRKSSKIQQQDLQLIQTIITNHLTAVASL